MFRLPALALIALATINVVAADPPPVEVAQARAKAGFAFKSLPVERDFWPDRVCDTADCKLAEFKAAVIFERKIDSRPEVKPLAKAVLTWVASVPDPAITNAFPEAANSTAPDWNGDAKPRLVIDRPGGGVYLIDRAKVSETLVRQLLYSPLVRQTVEPPPLCVNGKCPLAVR